MAIPVPLNNPPKPTMVTRGTHTRKYKPTKSPSKSIPIQADLDLTPPSNKRKKPELLRDIPYLFE